MMPSCSETKRAGGNSNSNAIEAQHGNAVIEVTRPEVDKPEQADHKVILVRLENRDRIKSMTEAVYMTDEKTGQRYRVPYFREILGVRSSGEQQYLLMLYSDNSLYGIDPIYPPVPCREN